MATQHRRKVLSPSPLNGVFHSEDGDSAVTASPPHSPRAEIGGSGSGEPPLGSPAPTTYLERTLARMGGRCTLLAVICTVAVLLLLVFVLGGPSVGVAYGEAAPAAAAAPPSPLEDLFPSASRLGGGGGVAAGEAAGRGDSSNGAPSSFPSLLSLLPTFSDCPEGSNFTLANVFGDSMVLQRRAQGHVWGWVGEGCTVEASLVRPPYPGGELLAVTIRPERPGVSLWVADIPPQEASLEGATLHFSASSGKMLELRDVLWGEVVLCSGQSNMAGYSQHSHYGPGSVASSLTVEGVFVPGVFDKSGAERVKQKAARIALREKEELEKRGAPSPVPIAAVKKKKKGGKKGKGSAGVAVPAPPAALRGLRALAASEEGGGGEGEEGDEEDLTPATGPLPPGVQPQAQPQLKGGHSGSAQPSRVESEKRAWGGWVAVDKPSPTRLVEGVSILNTAEAEEEDESAWEFVRGQVGKEAELPIRVFQVGEFDNWATEGPLNNLASPPQMPWQPAPTTLSPAALHFAAVCYFAGRTVAQGTPGVPVGLIESAWGGSFIQSWSSASAWEACGATAIPKDGWWSPAPPTALFNTMIAPFAIGPMALGGIIFYIGESQGSFNQVDYFSCALPLLLASWRSTFSSPDSWAVVIQMQGWVDGNLNQDIMAHTRDVQLQVSESRALPRIATVTAVDCGDSTSPFHSIHPRYKRKMGTRSGEAALAFLAGLPPPRGPVYLRAVSRIGTGLSVTVYFDPDTVVGGLVWADPSPEVPSSTCPMGVPRHTCQWFSILDSGGEWHNASATIGKGGVTLELRVEGARQARRTAVASQNGFGMWPVVNLYNAAGLPAYPWRRKIAVKGKAS